MISTRFKRHILKASLSLFPPKPVGDWFRASGDCLCPVCLGEYRLHPEAESVYKDPNHYEFSPGELLSLKLLCNGWRVHL